jgi:ribosomal protein L13
VKKLSLPAIKEIRSIISITPDIPEVSEKCLLPRLQAKKPEAIIEKAVKGMLPKNRLGSELFRNLHVYAGNEHPHEAQKPGPVNFSSIK